MKITDEISKWIPTRTFLRWFQWQARELYGEGDIRTWISAVFLALSGLAVPLMIYFSGSASYHIIDSTDPSLDFGVPPYLVVLLILSVAPYLALHGRIFRYLTPRRERRRAIRMQRWIDEWKEKHGKSDTAGSAS